MNSKFSWIIIFVSLVTVHSDNIKLIGTDGVVAVMSFTMSCSFFIYAVSFLLNGRKNGGFSNWSDYSSCTKSCEGGIQNRTRECNTPKPINGGKICIGIKMETRGCNHNLCPVDGGWSNWLDFSSCTKPCGGGVKEKTRECNNPKPQNGGKDCIGIKIEILGCNNDICPDFCHCNKSCNEHWLNHDYSGLQHLLNKNVFGQHIVNKIVGKAIDSHYKKNSKKPLVMSFHGSLGTGKSFVAGIIAKYLFEEGLKSKCVHVRIASYHYIEKSYSEKYKTELIDYIENNTKKCERSLFIFDEFDKMPEGLADVMVPYLDYHAVINGLDYCKNIFIFLSNTGFSKINNHVTNHYKSGNSRETITYVEMHKMICIFSFNIPGSFKISKIVEKALIDHYVPFLPLERKHVKQCAELEINRKNYISKSSTLEDIANEMHYFPEEEKWFSETGCKSVAKKVAMFL